jgi:stage II sporulation protein Q
MSDQKREVQSTEEAPKQAIGTPEKTSSSWKRFLSKRWVFPATYVAAAAIILTLMWVYQGASQKSAKENTSVTQTDKPVNDAANKGDAVAVNGKEETMQWPVKDRNDFTVTLPFFDSNASGESKQAAMIEYGETLTPHVGWDLQKNDKKEFEVVAAMSGKVTNVDKSPVAGNFVEITHNNGIVTVYQSLADIKVAKGAEVKKGDVIANAGRNELEKDEGIHLHFEVRQGEGGAVLNPEKYLGKQ